MDREARTKLEEFRRITGPVQNQAIDDFLQGELDRGDFIRRGAMFGLSLPTLGYVLAAVGEGPVRAAPLHGSSAAPAGSRLRLAIDGAPYGAIEPYTFNSTSEVDLAAPEGEYLTRVTGKGALIPELAIAWTPNADASRWTVKLRPNVKFHTGQPMTAQDVIATYKLLTDPEKGSAALTNFKGVLTPAGISAGPDQLTVIFELEAPTATFPYLISSATYQTIILPASYTIGTFMSKPQGTGPFVTTSYTPSVSATYDRFDGWWGGRPRLAGIDSTVYNSVTSLDAALLSGTADLADFAGDRTLFGKPQLRIFKINAAGQQEVAMRVDTPPWNDYRVRQALAYAIDRVALNAAVNLGYGVVGNDYCFAPSYPYSVPLPQRKQDLQKAKALLAAAGHPNGFSATLTTGNETTKVAIAQVVQADAKKIGIDLSLNLLPPTAYYASSTSTPWLNAPLTVTTWASRPTVNPYLTSTLITGAVWNAARYANPQFDAVVKQFTGAVAIADQRKYAKQLAEMQQHDTPYLVLAWPQQLDAGSIKVQGFEPEPLGMSLGTVYLKS